MIHWTKNLKSICEYMKYLLDTHTLIWFINGHTSLSPKARNTIEDPDSKSYTSIASIWEIAIKVSINKIELDGPFSEMKKLIIANDIEILPILFEDTLVVNSLPHHHRDPFDRIIISQSITNKLTVITKDPAFDNYDIKLLW
jgi:PIN domain nuclease of toxin-antitoxin system